jgi:hypothetical protein
LIGDSDADSLLGGSPPLIGFRLRCGDYRAFFDARDDNTIEITGVRNRRDAYR